MGATILDDAIIGDYCIIGAHALIPKGAVIPPRSLVMGTPGRIVREITPKEALDLENSARHYQELGQTYQAYFSQYQGSYKS
jgi:carbonic anhydrase/acetyltransferase-like protein (isoleucine patch superfamily)